MLLNLLSLLWFALVLIAAAILIVCGLRLLLKFRGWVCARCGQPAEQLTSFTCLGCRRDVREHGLITPRGTSPNSAFLMLVAWTAAVALVALAVTTLVRATSSSHQFFSLKSFTLQGVANCDRAECFVVGECLRGGGTVEADLFADLHLIDGRVSTLHVRVPGAQSSWTLPNADREEARGPFTRELLYKWLARSGANLDELMRPNTLDLLDDLHSDIATVAGGGNPTLPRARMQRAGPWRGGGGVDFSNTHYRLAATLWPTIWLAGIAVRFRQLISRQTVASSSRLPATQSESASATSEAIT